ncbi:hypothetical protein E2C01_036830 [Portunus trituberculatus]|uniref:Uncharacterized protein n=1 Tax=Portunus trituberculatus TaxID=210409 RepID=A0A5B7F7R3_PORTR|nr:hypothetical protein [Portunus trituberculatus]
MCPAQPPSPGKRTLCREGRAGEDGKASGMERRQPPRHSSSCHVGVPRRACWRAGTSTRGCLADSCEAEQARTQTSAL